MQTAKDRLVLFLSALGIGQKKFEESVGLSNGYVNKLKSSPSSKVIAKIVGRYPQLNSEWLISGEGEMFKKYIVDEIAPLTKEEEEKLKHEIAAGRVTVVPLYNLDVRGGFDENVESGQEAIIGLVPWPDAHSGDFAIEVSGMSMLPVIPPGSRVLLRRVEGWQTYLELNTLYTLELNDDRRLLKEVHRSDEGDAYFMLHSYNPRTPDQNVPKNFIRRVYKVVGIMTNYGF